MKANPTEGVLYNHRYEIKRKFGESILGSVYLAEDQSTSQTVVLRIINTRDSNVVNQYRNNFVTLASFSHPNLVEVLDLVQGEGEMAVALEYFPGESLKNHISTSHQFLLDICAQIASALDYVHAKGFGYIDFGADDILVDFSGNQPSLRIISTEIVQVGNDIRANIGNTNNYILENQKIFGELVYRMLVGTESPFYVGQRNGYVLARPSINNSNIPQELDTPLLRGLSPYFALNFSTCSELVNVLSSGRIFDGKGNFVAPNNSQVMADDDANTLIREIAQQLPGVLVRDIGIVSDFDVNSLFGSIDVGNEKISMSFEGLGGNEIDKIKPGSTVDFMFKNTEDGAVAHQIQVIQEAAENETRSDIAVNKDAASATEPLAPFIIEINKPLVSITDQPSGVDRLNFKRYTDAFADLVTNPELSTPITIGVYGQWGSGKSFLMGKIKEEIKKRQTKSSKANIHVIEFNAWVYSGSEHLWASLVTHLYRDIEKYLGLKEQWLRLGKAIRRSLPKALGVFSLYALLGLAVSLLLNFNELQSTSDSLTLTINAFVGSIIGGSALASLPVLWAALREFFDSLFLSRAKKLQNLAARPDFRNQIGVMADIKAEIGFIRELLKTGKKGKPTRLVLFIDDLDRCEHKKAVEVLQAIMLLLADEDGSPFVVFLGIDARVVVRAIEEHYGEVLVKAGINGYEYLDKIIQVPFVIPDSSQMEIENYVDSLLWESEAEKETVLKKMTPPASPVTVTANVTDFIKDEVPASVGLEGELKDLSEAHKDHEQEQPSTQEAPAPAPEEIPVTFTQAEREALKAHVSDLSSNPRKIKRIINIYRLARLILPKEINRTKAIRWILMTEQWPLHSAWIIEHIEQDAQTLNRLANKSVPDVYSVARANIHDRTLATLLSIDADPNLFEQFIKKEPVFSVQEIKALLPLTFNLNPAIRSEVSKQAIKLAEPKPEPNPSSEVGTADPGAERSFPSYPLLPLQN